MVEISNNILDYIDPKYRTEKDILNLFSIYEKDGKIFCRLFGADNGYDTIKELADRINDILKQASETERFNYMVEDMICELENSDCTELFDEGMDGAIETLQFKFKCDYETAKEVALYLMRRI